MTAHLTSHGTTDIKPEMLSGVQTGNGTPHDIIYVTLPMHAKTEKTTFSCKDDYCKALHIYWSGGEGLAH